MKDKFTMMKTLSIESEEWHSFPFECLSFWTVNAGCIRLSLLLSLFDVINMFFTSYPLVCEEKKSFRCIRHGMMRCF